MTVTKSYIIGTDTADMTVDLDLLATAIAAVCPDFVSVSKTGGSLVVETTTAMTGQVLTDVAAVLLVHSSAPDLANYKAIKRREVDAASAALFWSALTDPKDNMESRSYKLLAHLFKGMEASDNKNDRDGEADKRRPSAHRKDNQGAKVWKILEKEAAKRGLPSLDDLADIIEPFANLQWDLIAEIEALRPTSKDAIAAASDVPGVDTVYTTFISELSAITLPT